MSDLPPGWAWATLGDLGAYLNGRGFKKSEWRDAGRPIIRIQNLTGTSAAFNYFEEDVDDRHVVADGDLLMSWAATLGVFVWRGPEAVLNQHIFKVESYIDRGFHRHLLEWVLADLMGNTHGSGMVHITKKKFDATRVPLPPRAEQERIVAALEEQMSRVEDGRSQLQRARARVKSLEKSIITVIAATVDPPASWRMTTIGEAGSVSLGLQRSPKRHAGTNMRPYLRVANVFEDRIDSSDVMAMDMSDAEWERYRLKDGDVLLNEGQSPEFLGRPAVYRGEPADVAFTNSLIRFQAADGIDAEWALLVFRSHMHNRRFMRESQITTNIAHLSAGRLKTVEFPVPPLDEQRSRVAGARAALEACARMRLSIVEAEQRGSALRRSILAAAFSGKLVPQDPAGEPASALLERIRAERSEAKPARPARGKRAAGSDHQRHTSSLSSEV